MTVKEILETACSMIGREDVLSYLNGETENIGEDTLPTVNVMTSLLNLVIGELAGTFIPMLKKETVNAVGGKVYYADLLERCVKISSVYDKFGARVNYVHNPEYMRVFVDIATVEYEYIPPNYDLESEIGYTEQDVTKAALAYGLLAEYSISKGCFEEAVMWHERYVNSICAQKRLKNGEIKKRSFV